MSNQNPSFVRFTGSRFFAQRLVLSTLTGKPIHISKIRPSEPTHTGLAPHEISLLRLFEAVTNGGAVEISFTGTTMTYQPGLITGAIPGAGSAGDVVEHVIPATCNRGISYFLIPLALLAPFSKAHMNVRFSGPGVITAATKTGDISVDSFRTAILPLYGLFGIPTARIEVHVLQRSCAGLRSRGGGGSGGVVELRFASQVRLPKTLHMHQPPGRIRRIRGVAYCTGISASNNARAIHAAREVLNEFVSDIHIAAQYDQAPLQAPEIGKPGSKKRAGLGFGLSLVAEAGKSGALFSADDVAPAEGGVTPEEIGKRCAYQLLETVSQGGCVPSAATGTVLTLMSMGSEDVGRLRVGRDVLANEATLQLAKDLEKFGASRWGFRNVDDDNSGDFIVSVKGMGVGNVGRKLA